MTRYLVVLNTNADRDKAARFIREAPLGTRIEVKAAKRSLPQNDRMWAMLSDIAVQKDHNGRKYTPDQWKVIFLSALGREVQFVPSLDGKAFIPFGQSSSDLSKAEMSDLIELILSWGAENGVQFHDAQVTA
jgi:hypothetical protein